LRLRLNQAPALPTAIDEITTALEHHVVHARRITELELARTAGEAAAQRLRAIVHGEPVDPPLERAAHSRARSSTAHTFGGPCEPVASAVISRLARWSREP